MSLEEGAEDCFGSNPSSCPSFQSECFQKEASACVSYSVYFKFIRFPDSRRTEYKQIPGKSKPKPLSANLIVGLTCPSCD